MKKSIICLAIASAISTGAQAGVNDLLITEIVQNEKNPAMGSIEITNTHASEDFTFTDVTKAVVLASGKHSNDLKNPDGSLLLTGFTIPAGKSVVLLNSGATESYKAQIEAAGGTYLVGEGSGNYDNVYINGDDNFLLKHNEQIIDIVGPNSQYTDWALDSTFQRRVTAEGATPEQSATFDDTQWLNTSPAVTTGMGSPVLAPKYEAPEVFVCEVTHSIGEIQGSGAASEFVGETVIVEGVVVTSETIPVSGLYIRDLVSDNDPLTSDGIFVSFKGNGDSLKGKTICFESKVSENNDLTQLSTSDPLITDTDYTSTDAIDIEVLESDNGLFANTLERYESMLVRLPADLNPLVEGKQDIRISKTFGFNYDSYRNNISAAYLRPNMQPNQLNVAGSPESKAAQAQNDDYRLIIESSTKAPNGVIPYYPDFGKTPADNYVRINDSLVGLEGVLSYDDDNFSLTVTNELTSANFMRNIKRSDKPNLDKTAPKDHFTITLATQNLFNFFNSPFGGDQNNFGQNRGADSYQEYEQQKTKLVQAILKLDADVLGLMEMENNGFGLDSAVADLVNAINSHYFDEYPNAEPEESTENRYVFVGFDHNGNQIFDELDSIGSDAITTGIIYRPSKVSIERTRVIALPQQKAPSIVNDFNEIIKDSKGEILESGQNYNRDALVVTFIVNQTGKRLTMAVNHFKSKGSTCWEEWQGVEFGEATKWTEKPDDFDKQGSCENLRVAAAVRLGDELAKMGGDRIIIGDLNAYAQEDPMLVLTSNPRNKTVMTASHTYINKQPQFNQAGDPVAITHSYGYIDVLGLKAKERGETPWSYSYNDEVGSLDHILISPSLSDRLIDATDWHINAIESALYDYNTEYKPDEAGKPVFYEEDQFRSSDHDPAIMSLSYQQGETVGDDAVRLALWDKLMTVPYLVPGDIAQKGDIATVRLTQQNDEDRLDLSQLVLPNVVIQQAGQLLVEMEVFGAPAAFYHAHMELRRDGEVVSGSKTNLLIEVKSRDTLVPTLVTEPHDNSGGASGFIGLLSLLTLAGLRRRFFNRG